VAQVTEEFRSPDGGEIRMSVASRFAPNLLPRTVLRRKVDVDRTVLVIAPRADPSLFVGNALLRFCRDPFDADEAVFASAPDLIIVGKDYAAQPQVLKWVLSVSMRLPDVIVGLCQGAGVQSYNIHPIVDILSDIRRDSPARAVVTNLLKHSQAAPRIRYLAARGAHAVPSSLSEFVRHGIRISPLNLCVNALAASLGLNRRALDRRLASVGLVSAHEFITWTRLLLATVWLELNDYLVAQAAMELRFASPTAMRNTMRRYTNMTPRQICDAGGSDALLALFAQRLNAEWARGRRPAR
jgi:AraC-like DNA-binding protein